MRINYRGELFTTGDVASNTGCSIKTVRRWIDNGMLIGYRIPNSKERRVTRHELERFIVKYNLPCTDPEHAPNYE